MSQGSSNTILLPAIEINPYKPETFSGLDGGGYNARPGISRDHYLRYAQQIAHERRLEAAFNLVIEATESLKPTLAADYTHRLQQLPSIIQAEISALVTTVGPAHQLSPTAYISKELDIVNQLIVQRNQAFHQYQSKANAFFADNPIKKSRQDLIDLLVNRDIDTFSVSQVHAIYPAWVDSYSAAYSLALLTESLRILNERAASLTSQHAMLLAQQAQREAETRAQLAQREAEVRALQAQQEAEARKRKEEELRLSNEQEAAQAKIKAANTLTAIGAVAASRPFFNSASGVIPVLESAVLTLATALRSGAAQLLEFGAATVPRAIPIASLFFASKLGNGELIAFSTPLSELDPDAKQKWPSAATSADFIDLPMRIGSHLEENGKETFFLVSTDSSSSSVRRVTANLDSKSGRYNFTTAEKPGRNLTWTPVNPPGDSATVSPAAPPETPTYTGASVTPLQPQTETFPTIDDQHFDDYIIVFPIESGLDDVYVVFRDRRNDPGVASGNGQVVSGSFLDAAAQPTGAPIPAQIADQLRGQTFSSFNAFRRAFWKAMAADPLISKNFNKLNLALIRSGNSPFVPIQERVGGRKKHEIHHQTYISNGGDVYDMDNLRIVTPKHHIKTHSSGSKNEQ